MEIYSNSHLPLFNPRHYIILPFFERVRPRVCRSAMLNADKSLFVQKTNFNDFFKLYLAMFVREDPLSNFTKEIESLRFWLHKSHPNMQKVF